MSEQFTPGQRLTLAHDDGTVLVGTVTGEAGRYLLVPTIGASYAIEAFERNGFRVTHIDGEPVPAAPTLPTEPGHYITAHGDYRGFDGHEWYGRGEQIDKHDNMTPPFTRLVPEVENRAAIAREIAARVRSDIATGIRDTDGRVVAPRIAAAIEQKFGVTEQGS